MATDQVVRQAFNQGRGFAQQLSNMKQQGASREQIVEFVADRLQNDPLCALKPGAPPMTRADYVAVAREMLVMFGVA